MTLFNAMSTSEQLKESRINSALLALEILRLTPKKVAEITGIPESNLSVKRKKYCRSSDKDLVLIEKTFGMRFTESGYVFENQAATENTIHHKLYGKDAEFFNTHWWVYIWDRRGIGRLVLHIISHQEVTILNLPFEDTRKKDYSGQFAMDASKRFVVLNLHDSTTGEKDLHIKMAVGYGTKPIFCLGQYCNTHENGNLESGNMILMLETQLPPAAMQPAILRPDDDAYRALPQCIPDYFSDKHLNRISIPRNTIQHLSGFNEWMQQKRATHNELA